MRQDVFAVRPRAIGGDEVQPAGHDICWLTARIATMALLQRCFAVHLYVLPERRRRVRTRRGEAIGSLRVVETGWMCL